MHCWVSETLPFPKTITAPNMSGGKNINSSQIRDFSGSMLYPNDLNLSQNMHIEDDKCGPCR